MANSGKAQRTTSGERHPADVNGRSATAAVLGPGVGQPDCRDEVMQIRLSRTGVCGLALVVLLPWVVAGWVLLRGQSRTVPPRYQSQQDAVSADTTIPQHVFEEGPWGILEVRRIMVQPPTSLIDYDFDLQPYRRWVFRQTTPQDVQGLLKRVGLSTPDVEEAMKTAVGDPNIKGLVVRPPDRLVRGLSPTVRAALYAELSHDPDNSAQVEPFHFRGDTVHEWFAQSGVPADTVEAIKALVYKRGKFLLFSDPQLVLPAVRSATERNRLIRTLHRESTLAVKLRANDVRNIESIVDYWSRGNRRDEVEPLLTGIAGQSEGLNIVLFLPVFARTRLYTYDVPVATNKTLAFDCHWASLNFFNRQPNDRDAQQGARQAIIGKEYDVIRSPEFLGDVIILLSGDTAVHSCVYIADDIVFTKNGTGCGAPFILEKLEDLVEYYQQLHGNLRLGFCRRKDSY